MAVLFIHKYKTIEACLLLIFSFIFSALTCAQQPIFSPVGEKNLPTEAVGGYLARLQLDSPEDLKKALLRAESWHQKGKVEETSKPIAFIVHGPEVAIFFRENYKEYKEIVDLAARLTAFKVVDVQVCETRMGIMGRAKSSLVPFVGTVPFGPSAIEKLINKKDYVYF